MKTIKFLKMGMDKEVNGEALNHRFRGYIKNNKGERFFIEISLFEITKYTWKETRVRYGTGAHLFCVDHLFRAEYEASSYDPKYSKLQGIKTEANKKNILKFLKRIGCEYDNFVLVDWMNKDENHDDALKRIEAEADAENEK